MDTTTVNGYDPAIMNDPALCPPGLTAVARSQLPTWYPDLSWSQDFLDHPAKPQYYASPHRESSALDRLAITPSDSDATQESKSALRCAWIEYRQITDKAHKAAKARTLLEAAPRQWQAYKAATAAVERTEEALAATRSEHWNAAVYTLSKAHETLLEAARDFDQTMRSYVRRGREELNLNANTLEAIADSLPTGGDWHYELHPSDTPTSYWSTPKGECEHNAHQLIDRQRERLRATAGLMTTPPQT